MAKKKWKLIPNRDLECSGTGKARKPHKKHKSLLNVCFKVRKIPPARPGWGPQKDTVSEVFSGKTGKSLGFIGPDCTLVSSADQAVRSDYMNRYNTEGRLLNCMESNPWNRESAKRFRGAIKEGEKRITAEEKAKAKPKAKPKKKPKGKKKKSKKR